MTEFVINTATFGNVLSQIYHYIGRFLKETAKLFNIYIIIMTENDRNGTHINVLIVIVSINNNCLR